MPLRSVRPLTVTLGLRNLKVRLYSVEGRLIDQGPNLDRDYLGLGFEDLGLNALVEFVAADIGRPGQDTVNSADPQRPPLQMKIRLCRKQRTWSSHRTTPRLIEIPAKRPDPPSNEVHACRPCHRPENSPSVRRRVSSEAAPSCGLRHPPHTAEQTLSPHKICQFQRQPE